MHRNLDIFLETFYEERSDNFGVLGIERLFQSCSSGIHERSVACLILIFNIDTMIEEYLKECVISILGRPVSQRCTYKIEVHCSIALKEQSNDLGMVLLYC